MTTNRFVKGEPSATKSERVDFKNPKFCEIRGCKTRYVPSQLYGKGMGVMVVGYADLLVPDRHGALRGICAEHYHNELVRQGKASNQDLLDHEGRISKSKLQDHWDSLAQIELEETAKRKRRSYDTAA